MVLSPRAAKLTNFYHASVNTKHTLQIIYRSGTALHLQELLTRSKIFGFYEKTKNPDPEIDAKLFFVFQCECQKVQNVVLISRQLKMLQKFCHTKKCTGEIFCQSN